MFTFVATQPAKIALLHNIFLLALAVKVVLPGPNRIEMHILSWYILLMGLFMHVKVDVKTGAMLPLCGCGFWSLFDTVTIVVFLEVVLKFSGKCHEWTPPTHRLRKFYEAKQELFAQWVAEDSGKAISDTPANGPQVKSNKEHPFS